MLRNTINLKKSMNKNKKADLTFGQIVTAIIALIVLVILIMIFTGKMQGIVAETDSCRAKGGICTSNACEDGAFEKFGNYEDCTDEEVCCIKVFDS